MFEPGLSPRVFGLPPGADFPRALIDGILARVEPGPEALARVRIIVNTRRMARRMRAILDSGPARLQPRIDLVTSLEHLVPDAGLPAVTGALRRRLELVQLISKLLDAEPDLAPRAALYDLADSLATLLDEMQGEGIAMDNVTNLDVSDQSGHWQRALKFLKIAGGFLDRLHERPDQEARQRRLAQEIGKRWEVSPPDTPVILAGSTGSRGTTRLLMETIARLPQGAVVLPGFDFDVPGRVWQTLGEPAQALTAEDHPQFRFFHFLENLGVDHGDVGPWHEDAAPCPARNRLVSLALRPAPVTDQWLGEGPGLTDIGTATDGVTVLEAPTPRAEAMTIAMRLREAAETGQTAALITPDRMLTRQVTAALDRWNVLPDDSAGTPLQLSPPGRFLRHVAGLFDKDLTAEALLTLLKHPLTHSGAGRGAHLLLTRDLELKIRAKGWAYPTAPILQAWAEAAPQPEAPVWAEWLVSCFMDRRDDGDVDLPARVEAHRALANRIARGHLLSEGGGTLWDQAAGREAQKVMTALDTDADAGGPISARDYADLFASVLSREVVRDRDAPHPHILIWGTLEARVLGADLLILGGLNEGSWPELPSPDPWLNRKMRLEAGLLLPERRIGLAAHDFQQAMGAREVWLTRSIRSDEAETVPSRWLNRLTNLLDGLPEAGGRAALEDMKGRGATWLARASLFESPGEVAAAQRPKPVPPPGARPRRLSVTEIKTLVRDPYAIYARHVLRLRPLDPLMRLPDALLRGITAHDALDRFVQDTVDTPDQLTVANFLEASRAALHAAVPWPSARLLWQARMARIAQWFVDTENLRRRQAIPVGFERRGTRTITARDFTLTCVADRIDQRPDGALVVYDYKTGQPPSGKEQRFFDRQLLLEAAIAEAGGFEGIDPAPVARACYIGLGREPDEIDAPLDTYPPDEVWNGFTTLIGHYLDGGGFTSRRAMQRDAQPGPYDQLARYGEWAASDAAQAQEVGQ